MSFENLSQSQQQTRDSIGSNPAVLPVPKITRNEVRTWQEPLVIHDRDINNSWIAGSSTNAIVGTWTGTAGGGQLVVGGTTNTETLLRVVPNAGQWVNFLRATVTNTDDTVAIGLLDGTNTTGTVDTGNFRIDLDNSEEIIWQVSLNNGTITKATPIFDTDAGRTNITFDTGFGDEFTMTFPFTLGASGVANLYISTDGGSTWQDVDNNTEATLTSPGSDVQLKITANSDSLYWKTADANGDEVPILVRLT